MNLPETTTNRNPRSVNDRRSHQCARPGWRPRKGTPHALAADIAASIREHLAAGHTRWVKPEEFTQHPEIVAWVHQQLASDAQR